MPPVGDDAPSFGLAPGLRVVRRGVSQLQVGLLEARRAVLPRTHLVEATLASLIAPGPATVPGSGEVLSTLRQHGCLVEHDHLARAARRRREARVRVDSDLPGARDLLDRAGIGAVGDRTPPDVVLLGGLGEIDRDRLDPLIRDGTAHLVVRLVDGAALLGPFVVPGVTACLRCIDAQRSVADPDHVPVTSRYLRATGRAREDGVPDVTDPVLTALATAWAVRDVVAHLDGRRPSTWSRTVLLDPEPSHRLEQDWSRHPECGCSWSALAPGSGTMGV